MVLEIDERILEKSQMTESDIRLELAVSLFDKNRITLVQASDIAGLTAELFKEIATQRGLFYSYQTKIINKWQPLSLNIKKSPKDLSYFAIKQTDLAAIAQLFEGEPSAEELCKML
jgi:predicted HTH domain antitoxin